MVERYARRALERGEHDTRLHIAHMRDAQQLLEDDRAQRFQILAEHLQDEVVSPGGREAIGDLVEQRDLALEARYRLVGMLGELDVYDRLDLEADPVRVQNGGIPLDDAGRLERADAASAGRRRQTDELGKLDHGQPTLSLQLGQDTGIEAIEIHDDTSPV